MELGRASDAAPAPMASDLTKSLRFIATCLLVHVVEMRHQIVHHRRSSWRPSAAGLCAWHRSRSSGQEASRGKRQSSSAPPRHARVVVILRTASILPGLQKQVVDTASSSGSPSGRSSPSMALYKAADLLLYRLMTRASLCSCSGRSASTVMLGSTPSPDSVPQARTRIV
jgi:hypothetical protein